MITRKPSICPFELCSVRLCHLQSPACGKDANVMVGGVADMVGEATVRKLTINDDNFDRFRFYSPISTVCKTR